MANPWDDPEVREWVESAANDMLPKMRESAMSITIFSGKVDPKLCMELGAAILYDKPIVLLVTKDENVPQSLQRVAAAIVRGSMDDPQTKERLTAAIEKVLPHKS